MSASEYVVKVRRDFERTDKAFNEPAIETAMRAVLKDYSNGKVVI